MWLFDAIRLFHVLSHSRSLFKDLFRHLWIHIEMVFALFCEEVYLNFLSSAWAEYLLQMREPLGMGREYDVYEGLWEMYDDVNNSCEILRRNALGSFGMFQIMQWRLLTGPCSWVHQVDCFKMPFGPVRYGDGKLGGGGLWLSASLSYHLHARPETEDMWNVGQ